MSFVFRFLNGIFQVDEIAFAANSRLTKTQVVPTDWSGPTRQQLRVLNRPAYLRKREGGPFGSEIFAPLTWRGN